MTAGRIGGYEVGQRARRAPPCYRFCYPTTCGRVPLAPLCDLVVKKNRITTVTITVVERPPRCQCRTSSSTDRTANRTRAS
jgi:hypothetical protein